MQFDYFSLPQVSNQSSVSLLDSQHVTLKSQHLGFPIEISAQHYYDLSSAFTWQNQGSLLYTPSINANYAQDQGASLLEHQLSSRMLWKPSHNWILGSGIAGQRNRYHAVGPDHQVETLGVLVVTQYRLLSIQSWLSAQLDYGLKSQLSYKPSSNIFSDELKGSQVRYWAAELKSQKNLDTQSFVGFKLRYQVFRLSFTDIYQYENLGFALAPGLNARQDVVLATKVLLLELTRKI